MTIDKAAEIYAQEHEAVMHNLLRDAFVQGAEWQKAQRIVAGEKKEFYGRGYIDACSRVAEEVYDEIDDADDGTPVDLGLPSGTLWQKSNLGGSKPSDFGKFYSWADTEGYDDDAGHEFSWSTYKYGTSYDNMTKYNDTDDKLVLDNDDDPVWVASSGQYKSPTQEQLQELMDNTDHQWIRLTNGVNGMKFVNKNDDTKYIFIPAAGHCYDSDHSGVGSWGCVWSSSRDSGYPDDAWYMDFSSGDVYMDYSDRCYGFSVRGVVIPKNKEEEPYDNIDDTDDGQPVDLGLPSGTLWQKSNLGGSKPSDFGKFYSWADTQGYDGDTGHNFSWDTYKWGTSGNITKYNNSSREANLHNEDDPVRAATHGKKKSPSEEQLRELIDNTDHQWVKLANGVSGMKFISKNDNTKYIFIPAAGCYDDSDHYDVNSWGYVWSSSYDSTNPNLACFMYFDSRGVYTFYSYRYYGVSVRGVMDK